ncbi:hypothetical protein N7468_006025 [Penicillium chermesinum]|uniref:Uncharacterized protein n=1 Tax=Penicillium chermesinum TaxID=63820 RepID=A0A9W9P0E4_9EURO|nr:uncharacterized protein N7468_006025 [Penicillium chermesinum]KAJ5233069.1 hypothetical protein N7468_006025 [Penicillium chermesinum]
MVLGWSSNDLADIGSDNPPRILEYIAHTRREGQDLNFHHSKVHHMAVGIPASTLSDRQYYRCNIRKLSVGLAFFLEMAFHAIDNIQLQGHVPSTWDSA